MRALIIIAMLFAALPAAAKCIGISPMGPAGFVNVRSGPGTEYSIVDRIADVGNGSEAESFIFCGRVSYSTEGNPWLYVAGKSTTTRLWTYGYVSRKVLGPAKEEYEGRAAVAGSAKAPNESFLNG